MKLQKSLSLGVGNFVKHSGFKFPTIVQILIWTIGLSILISLTVREFIPLFEQYKTNNEATQTKIIGKNNSFKPPSIAFCIPRSAGSLLHIAQNVYEKRNNQTITCEECDSMANHSWDVWNLLDFSDLHNVEDYRQLISEALIRKLFSIEEDHNITFDILNVNNSDWHLPIVDAVWDFFECITTFDARMNFDVDNATRSCFRIQHADTILSDKKTIKILFTKFVNTLCQHIRYETASKSACAKALNAVPSAVLGDGFCFEFPMQESGSARILVDSYSKRHGIWKALNCTSDHTFDVYADTAIITWPTGHQGVSDVIYVSESLNDNLLKEHVAIKYLITMAVEGKQHETSHCYQESTPAVCAGNCMVSKMIQKCGCIPFTFRNTVKMSINDQKLLPFCNSTYYADCRLNKTEESFDCENNCNNPCEYISYQFHITRMFYNNSLRRSRQFYLNVSPILVPFIQFNVTVKDTPEQFMTRIAAIFNLYLGFSGLSGVAIVVYVGNLFQRWFRWKRNSRRTKIRFDRSNGEQRNEVVQMTTNNISLKELKQQLEILTKQQEDIKEAHQFLYRKLKAEIQEALGKRDVKYKRY